MTTTLVLLAVIACAAVTGVIAKRKGRSVAEGVLLGFFLTWIGLVIELFLPRRGSWGDRGAAAQAWEGNARQPLRSNEGASIVATAEGGMPEEEKLQEFGVDSVMFYDGSGHRLGPSQCVLTNKRLIIDDARGGIHQIALRNISGITTPGQFVSPKMLRVNVPGMGYDIYCFSKDQKRAIEGWLREAIMRSFG